MFRQFVYSTAIAVILSSGIQAGGLDALADGGISPGAQRPDSLRHEPVRRAPFQGLWSPDYEGDQYQPGSNVQCFYRVRYYKQGWKFKKYATFRNFSDAKYFLLKSKMEGYTANLSVHEVSKAPQKKDYWLP